MANQVNPLRRSKSVISLIPRFSHSRPSEEAISSGSQSRGRLLFASASKPKISNSGSNLRVSSVDRKARSSSTSRLSKLTSTPLSSQRTPVGHTSSKKDVRPVHEKIWQQDQFLKVKAFLEDYPDIANNLKPPSLQTFIDTMKILFECIDDRVDINLTNYKKQIPAYMKILGYPAQIPLSMLKCVNTSHSWPQVIALFSWLVDLIQNVCYSSVTIVDTVQEESEYLQVTSLVNTFNFKRYMSWNKGDDEGEVDDEFEKEMIESFGFNEAGFLKLQSNLERLLPELQKYEIAEEEITDSIDALQKELNLKRNEISEFRNIDNKTWEQTCQDYSKQIADAEEALLSKRHEIAELKEIVSRQPCTFEEFETRKQKVEALKHELGLQAEKIEKRMEIIDNFDYKLTSAKQNLNRAILDQNLAVMKWEHLNPTMKSLELKTTGCAQIKDEIARVSVLKNDYYKQFLEELNSTKLKYESSTAEHKLLKQNFDCKQDDLEKMKQLKNHAEVELDKYEFESESELKSLSMRLNKETNDHKSLLNEKLIISSEIDSLQEQLPFTKKKVTDAVSELEKMKTDILDFFVKLHNITVKNLSKIEEMEEKVTVKIQEAVEKKVHEKEQILEYLNKFLNDINSENL